MAKYGINETAGFTFINKNTGEIKHQGEVITAEIKKDDESRFVIKKDNKHYNNLIKYIGRRVTVEKTVNNDVVSEQEYEVIFYEDHIILSKVV